jgi:D-lactate dehydrogenase
MAQSVIPCALEFIDGNALHLMRQYSALDLPENAGALLIIEVDGLKAGLEEATKKITHAAKNTGLINICIAQTTAQVDALWNTRKSLAPTLRKAAPKRINEDVVVPVTEIPKLIDGLNQISEKYQIPIINFGHAGNGNIHVNLLFDPAQADQKESSLHCLDAVFSLVLKLNGSLSGEHGIGLEKKAYIEREIDENSLILMRRIKNQFDPNGILNPEKLFPNK